MLTCDPGHDRPHRLFGGHADEFEMELLSCGVTRWDE